VLAGCGLHPGQDLLLSALWREDGIAQAELALRLGIEAPTVSRALERLERAGYVRREPGRGRSRSVYLTEQGRALRGPVEQAWASADRELTARIGEPDMTDLSRILSRLTPDELAG
jgi:DNA-binding MarR family transcriptional regulator